MLWSPHSTTREARVPQWSQSNTNKEINLLKSKDGWKQTENKLEKTAETVGMKLIPYHGVYDMLQLLYLYKSENPFKSLPCWVGKKYNFNSF